MKKAILSVLSIMLLLCALSFSVDAASETDVPYGVEGGNLYFDKESGTITDCDETVISATIPDRIDGIKISKIGDRAFIDCKNLVNVTIPESVIAIGNSAFSGCSSLSNIAIPNSVTVIGNQAFYGSGLQYVTLSEHLASIGYETFYGCRSLLAVTIPDSVSEIQHGAFNNCESLKNIYLGIGVQTVEAAAFCGDMPKDRHVTFRGEAPLLGEHVFDSFNWETNEFYIEEGLCLYYYEGKPGWTSPEWNGYPCQPIEGLYALAVEGGYLYFDKSNQTIRGCDSTVTNLVIPELIDGVEPRSVYGFAFSNNSTLTSLSLPGTITYIDDCAFRFCTALKEIDFSEGLKYIDHSAFVGCTALETIVLPNTLTNIGMNAFNDCTALANIKLGKNVTWIWDSAFDNTAYMSNPSNWEDGLLYLGNWLLSVGENLEEIHIKAGTVGVAEWSTDGSKDTCRVVTFPGSMRYICDSAFKGYTQLTEVVFPKNIVDCGFYAFMDCPNLTAAYFYGDVPNIAPDAFLCWADYPVFRESFVTFYYIEGTEGWIWENESMVNYFHPTPWSGEHTHEYVGSLCNICGSTAFSDVASDAWYADSIEYAVLKGLMNGMSATTFEPETQMNRAMLVTVLWRYAGAPIDGGNTFSDVEDGQWYTDAIAWAAHNGIVNGVAENRFDPNGTITREQLATILYRYAKSSGLDVSSRDTLAAFPDTAQISSWASDAISWAVAEGLINGADGKLMPQGNATRAQVATILMRFIENTTA